MKRISVLMSLMLLVAVIFVGCSSTSMSPSQKYLNELNSAYMSQDKAKIEQAANSLSGLIVAGKSSELDYYNAALAQYKLADYLDLQAAGGVDKSGPAEKADDMARDYLKKAIELKPDFYDAYSLKYNVLLKKFGYVGFPRLMQYVGEISQDLEKIKELKPNDANTKLIEGIASANNFPQPEPEETIAIFNEALKLDQKMADAYYQIAVVQLKNNKKDEAVTSLKKALELNPNCFWAKKKLAELEGK